MTWIDSTLANADPVRMDACCFWRLSSSAAAFSGVPSWKLMPDRRTMVKTVKSGFEVIDWARYGWTWPVVVTMASGSNTVRP